MYFSALFGGLLSFISPCILPLIPIYISYISGVTVKELKESKDKNVYKKAILNSIAFVLGFSVIFTLMGTSASYIGTIIVTNKILLAKISGILIIIFGILYIFKIDFIYKFLRINVQVKSVNLFTSFLVGIFFAFGWSPCVGPILSSILVIAANTASLSKGAMLLFIYSLGLGIPFVLASIFMGFFVNSFNFLKTNLITYVMSIFLVSIGLYMFVNGRLPSF
ncbi:MULTISPECIES: cytochrome c biogenesis CcdA family protein [Desulfurella]|jgi:cytochrome c-type biogenesis protein|uniref:cytochrome c biogenesis CcdA family protein n=1 Tax=Desulfurella TaxID=33001 RepID=UPI0003E08944|nr:MULTISPECIES: cytochrome c biogenesis protein CcdA [Desulfurella]AHF97015.1 cytochrome C biogenesis protein DsbD [Desulfurella acetivorans A63]PMP63132.1 MAG: cytochrome C biogenesis protein CcdA [Desulfurella multipotens]PMP93080.1 MAG: cytochrome C biogenesis protein CcdA [Desulfurella sp.]HEX12950.1 cytochrome C biogenesis protein CcdA [Desulfurella acetivorans]